MTDAWQPLCEALDRLQDENRAVSFWIRDDDAAEPTYPLERLFKLCAAHQVPLLLAVIPQPATLALAQLVQAQPMIQPCQHGYAHFNHAPAGQRAQELGYRRIAVICDELRAGRDKLQQLFSDRLHDILVPPWNRYDTSIIANVAALGFRAISGFGRLEEQPAGDLVYLNTHVDIIDWRNVRKTKPIVDLIAIVRAEVERALQTSGEVAFLTHHLSHDEAAWDFLEGLFAHTRSHPAVAWRSASDFLNRS